MTDAVDGPAQVELVVAREIKPGITLIELNRPDNLNALNAELVEALHSVLSRVRNDSKVRAIVVTGRGTAFCAGLDLRAYGSAPGSEPGEGRPQAGMRVQKHIADLHEAFRGARAPVIAAINGAAVGGGMSLALFCDIRLASTTAWLEAAFIKRGLSSCDIGASWLLPRIIGFAQAADILLTGRRVGAAEALDLGLVSSVVAPDELLDAAIAKAELIAANAPMGVWMTKEGLWSNLEVSSFRAAIDLENRTQILCSMTKDHREAVAAFLEKRIPDFQNH